MATRPPDTSTVAPGDDRMTQPSASLCDTCRHFADCIHRRQSQAPIMFCELFEEGEWSVDLVSAIIDKIRGQRGGLISILEGIQAKYGYLPEGALQMVAERTGRPLVDIYGVATFYSAFSLEPRGKHLCSVCRGTACHVRNAPAVVGEFQRKLGVAAGQTTDDGEFTLETVNCLGACALGPVVVVDGHYFSNVDSQRVDAILDQTRVGLDHVEVGADQRVFPVELYCARCNHSLMDVEHQVDDHPSIRVTISFGRRHGWLLLSSLYGSYESKCEHEIPTDTVVNFFCPHCHAELTGATDCPVCTAPMVPLIVRGGGMVQICSRRGCRSHMLDLDGVNL